MRIVFIGCVQLSLASLERIFAISACEVVGVVTRRESHFNSDFICLADISRRYSIPCIFADETNEFDIISWIKEKNPDVIYCFGWSTLLKRDILAIAPLGVIGFHPAPLPQNRGRHPIIWTLALGLQWTASTFFFMDEGADSGDILNQVSIEVLPEETAQSLYSKIMQCALGQIVQFSEELSRNTYTRTPQDHSLANYWRKRSKQDGCIDWRMSARTIHNLVRALSHPYVGAHLIYKNNEIKVWRSEIIEPFHKNNLEPGKILDIVNNALIIKCGEGALKIVEHEFFMLPKIGEYL